MSTLTPQDFVAKWRQVTVKEKSGYQEHFRDLCRLIGHPTPTDDDPTGERYAFEAGANKQKGGQGWADVWKRGFFAWEYKGKHANLDKAYQQLLQYRESLQNPPLLVVSDMEVIEVHTNFTNTVKQVTKLGLNDLLTPRGLQQLRDVFTNPEAFRAPQTSEQVTRQAAAEFAELAAHLRKYGEEPQRIAHFLIRLLFCLFAEDVGLLPDKVFSQIVEATKNRAPLFVEELGKLFAAMSAGGLYLLKDIPHFNGRLFDSAEVLPIDSDAVKMLLKVAALDWSSIEPSILGTLFERSLDPAKRAQLGAHYTSRDDILLIVEPVLMAPLRRRWAEVQQQARALADERDAASTTRTARDRQGKLRELLTGFSKELAGMKVLDPACGSANFLYVALKQLLDLEKEVITLAQDLAAGGFFPEVKPEQLYGIEVNELAHELAQVTVWIGYIQWLRDNGFGRPSEPILKPLDTIRHMDAILAFDAAGKPVKPPWPAADVIVGNPPFLGGNRLRRELGNDYADQLFMLYDGRVPAFADLVCYWFARTQELIASSSVKRAGLLSTNSIRHGVNRRVLDQIKATGDIFMAWEDRPWVLNGADVRVSMIGFDDGSEKDKALNGASVVQINSDLTAAIDLSQAKRLQENFGIAFEGTKKGADFDIAYDVAAPMLYAPLNPNGRPNSDVLKPWYSGAEVSKRPRNIWIIDFGTNLSEADAALYERPFAYIEAHVKPKYGKSRKTWWLHERTRPEMREALAPLSRFIATTRHSKYRLFVWAPKEVIPDSALVVCAREDDYFFGVLQSHAHEIWSLRRGSWLGIGNDPRYTPTTTFETFPFPWPPGQEPQGDPRVEAIAAAARRLVELRDNWLNPPGATEADLKKRTLTNLYNERPTWLANAHRKLDESVLSAYGWPADVGDEAILERLLALNLERAAGEGAAGAPTEAEGKDL